MSDELDDFIRKFGDDRQRAERKLDASRRRSWMPRQRVAVAGAAVGLALGLAVAVLPGSDAGSGTALAAAQQQLSTEDAIVHTVMWQSFDFPVGSGLPKKEALRPLAKSIRSESWTGPRGSRTVTGDREAANRWGDLSKPVTRTFGRQKMKGFNVSFESFDRSTNQYRYGRGFVPEESFERTDRIDEVRSLFAEGKVRDAGDVLVGGRPARKFVAKLRTIKTPSGSKVRSLSEVTEYYVDPETFAPIRLRKGTGKDAASRLWEVYDFEKFERLPLNEQTLRLLKIDVPAGAERKRVR